MGFERTLTIKKTIYTGILAGILLNISGLVTFGLLGVGINTDKILVSPPYQNEKIIAVWNTLEPLPLSVTDSWIIALAYIGFGILLAFMYRSFSIGWPSGIRTRGWRMTAFLLFTFLFWEVSTPINLFSEPLSLVAVDLAFWTIMACVTGYGLVAGAEYKRKY